VIERSAGDADADRIGVFECVLEPRRDTLVVRPSGELDCATRPEFEVRVDEAVEAGVAHVVLDLRRVTFVDSSGLRAIPRMRSLLPS
jgi:anti-anti-sigma factor